MELIYVPRDLLARSIVRLSFILPLSSFMLSEIFFKLSFILFKESIFIFAVKAFLATSTDSLVKSIDHQVKANAPKVDSKRPPLIHNPSRSILLLSAVSFGGILIITLGCVLQSFLASWPLVFSACISWLAVLMGFSSVLKEEL